MCRSTLATLALLLATSAVPPCALAQTIYFEDTFDSDLDRWTAGAEGSGPSAWGWGAADEPGSPGLPSPGGAARMGDPDCTFTSVFGNVQTLELTDAVYIPLHADGPELSFRSYAHTEACFHWDFHEVHVRRAGEATWSWVGSPCGQQSWNVRTIDLSAYRGDAIHVRFHFDPIDPAGNETLGWIIDDVRITAEQCYAVNYCTASPNSGSATGARMGYSGSGRVHLNSFVLEAFDGPPNEFALFFCGPDRVQTPLGDGTLCVGPGATGIMRLGPIGRFDPLGRLSFPFDFTSPQVAAGEFLAGTNWQFQCWFRDGAGGPAGSNLTDGLSVTFCP